MCFVPIHLFCSILYLLTNTVSASEQGSSCNSGYLHPAIQLLLIYTDCTGKFKPSITTLIVVQAQVCKNTSCAGVLLIHYCQHDLDISMALLIVIYYRDLCLAKNSEGVVLLCFVLFLILILSTHFEYHIKFGVFPIKLFGYYKFKLIICS